MIAVLDYGIGNLRSAEKALQHVGGDARLVTSADEARGADAVVLPGVGAFGACMDALRASGLDEVALEAADAGTPFLGICVGMQLLYEGSDEDPDAKGLGILPGRIRRLPDDVKRPQMQWNLLELAQPDDPIVRGLDAEPWVYFVHSYAAEDTGDTIATCDYGGPVVGVVGHLGGVRVDEVHPRRVVEAVDERIVPPTDVEHVPLHLRALDVVRQQANATLEDPQPLDIGRLVGALVEELHAHADAEERGPVLNRSQGDVVETGPPQRRHARAERADTGEDDACRAIGVLSRRHEAGVGADRLERLLRRPEVADPVVEDGDH